MKTKLWAISLMIVCTALTSSAQILYKTGANKLSWDIYSIITNWHILTGLILYGLGAILVIFALKGGEVSVLYPIVTSSYIWVSLASGYFFNEVIGFFRWIGIGLIIIGIILITIGAKDKEVIEFTEPV